MAPSAIYTPSTAQIEATNLTRYRKWINQRFKLNLETYHELQTWSRQCPQDFWPSLADHLGIVFGHKGSKVLGESSSGEINPLWFPDSTLSFAENLLQGRSRTRAALVFAGEGPPERESTLSQAELYDAVRCCANGLSSLGVRPGDRISSWCGTVIECVIVCLAASAVGAIWSAAAPEFGTDSILDRFVQIRPKVIVATNGVLYAGKAVSQMEKLATIVASLAQEGLQHCVVVPHVAQFGTRLGDPPLQVKTHSWSDLLAFNPGKPGDDIDFWRGNFNAPLWILYSSGTTGKPKAIIHRAGGVLLQLKKEIVLHADMKPGDSLCFFTTSGWMMFCFDIVALACDLTLVLRDGSPTKPKISQLWDTVEKYKLTYLGVSPKYLQLLEEARYYPKDHHNLQSLRALGCTGSPLNASGYDFIYKHIKSDVLLGNTSGGTDICASFVGPIPTEAVYRGQVQGVLLGMSAEAWTEEGDSVMNQPGSLICTAPIPSFPLGFWNDAKHERFHESYFSQAKAKDGRPVWYHGDSVEFISATGGVIMHGRSDALLNPHGIRFGTAEVYAVLEKDGDDRVEDYLAIGQYLPDGDQQFILFVKLRDERADRLDPSLVDWIRKRIKNNLSPKHVPAQVMLAPDIPFTSNGKKVELPVKKIMNGTTRSKISGNALRNPESLEFYFNLAESGASGRRDSRL